MRHNSNQWRHGLLIRLILLTLLLFLKPSLSFGLSIMTYNVENLFDTIHATGKHDWEYLPLASKQQTPILNHCRNTYRQRRQHCLFRDWNSQVVAAKLEVLATTITSYHGPRGPDILVLSEIENAAMLEKLRSKLPTANYRVGHLHEGGDRRGIDNAVLSRFPLAAPSKLWRRIPGSSYKSRRGFLQVPLRLPNGVTLNVIAVHLPSQFYPTKRRRAALDALQRLSRLTENDFAQVVTVIAGDFNISARESAELFRGIMAPNWLVSHLDGCQSCRGTYYYSPKKSWSFLDAIVIQRQGRGADCKIIPGSIQVLPKVAAASDHHPLILDASCQRRKIP